MRQLVSVVTPESVSYFLAEEGTDTPVQQVAQVLNTGLAVADVIDLGSNLLGALRLNGHKSRPRAVAPPTQPALEPAPPEPAPVKRTGRPKGIPGKRPMQRWGFTGERVLADLRAHPGTTYVDAVDRLTGGQGDQVKARQAYSASLQLAERKMTQARTGAHVRREQFLGTDNTGHTRNMSRLYLEEPAPTPPEPEPEE